MVSAKSGATVPPTTLPPTQTTVSPTQSTDDKFNYDREPSIRVDKLIYKFGEYLEDNFSKHPSFKTNVGSRFQKIGAKMINYYKKKNPVCNYWSESNDMEDEDEKQR